MLAGKRYRSFFEGVNFHSGTVHALEPVEKSFLALWHLFLEIGDVIIAKMKILEQPELLLESRVYCEFSPKRIFAEEKIKYSLLLVHSGFPISIRHGYLVEISQHRIHQFVGGFHLSCLLSHHRSSLHDDA